MTLNKLREYNNLNNNQHFTNLNSYLQTFSNTNSSTNLNNIYNQFGGQLQPNEQTVGGKKNFSTSNISNNSNNINQMNLLNSGSESPNLISLTQGQDLGINLLSPSLNPISRNSLYNSIKENLQKLAMNSTSNVNNNQQQGEVSQNQQNMNENKEGGKENIAQNANKTSQAEGKKKSKKPFQERVGDWVCIKCKNLNFSFRLICNRCQLTKIESDKLFENYMKNLFNYVNCVKLNEITGVNQNQSQNFQNQNLNQNINQNQNQNIQNIQNQNIQNQNQNIQNMNQNQNQQSQQNLNQNQMQQNINFLRNANLSALSETQKEQLREYLLMKNNFGGESFDDNEDETYGGTK